MSNTNERLLKLARVTIFPTLNLCDQDAVDNYKTLKSDIETDKVAQTFKKLIPEALTAEGHEQIVLTLTACLAQDFAYLRRYNSNVSQSYKDDVSQALLSNDPEKLCDSIAAVYCGFVAACTMG